MPNQVSPPLPSTYQRQYSLKSIANTVDVTTGVDLLARPNKRTVIIDALDQQMCDMMDGIRHWNNVMWRGGKFTTFCYEHFGASNVGFIILAFNGLSTPRQLRPGMVIKVPVRSEVDKFFIERSRQSDGIGTVITI